MAGNFISAEDLREEFVSFLRDRDPANVTRDQASLAAERMLRQYSDRNFILSRFGDVYGSVVNLAARLTSVARPGTILVDRELAAELGDEPAYDLRSRRPVSVRGYNRLRPSALRRARQASPSRVISGR